MRILLVEDDVSLSNAVKKILEKQGFFVDAVYDGESAVDYACAVRYELIILDIMLPGLDGFEVVRRIRQEKVSSPVLMLTARSDVRDKVSGLNRGADDYMTKPFDTDELLARVGALTRRTGEVVMDRLSHEDLTLDLNSAELRAGERSVRLSRKEFEVLRLFLANPAMVMDTERLINAVWGMESEATDNNVEVYISFIRKKLKYLGSRVGIKKIQKIGYRLEVE